MAFGIMLLCGANSFAARPLSVEDAGVVEKGFEVEIGHSGNTAKKSLNHETGFVLNFAAMKDIHVGFEKAFTTEINKGSSNHTWGEGDTVIAVKYALANHQSLKLAVKIADGDDENGFGDNFLEYGFTYAKEREFGKTIAYVNMGYNFYDRMANAGEVKNNGFIGLGLSYPIVDNLSLCGEVIKTTNQGNNVEVFEGEVNSLIGFVWIIKDIPIDFSYVLSPDSEDYNYSVGITIGF